MKAFSAHCPAHSQQKIDALVLTSIKRIGENVPFSAVFKVKLLTIFPFIIQPNRGFGSELAT